MLIPTNTFNNHNDQEDKDENILNTAAEEPLQVIQILNARLSRHLKISDDVMSGKTDKNPKCQMQLLEKCIKSDAERQKEAKERKKKEKSR